MQVNLKLLKSNPEPTDRARSEGATIVRMLPERAEDVVVELVVCRPISRRWEEDQRLYLDSHTQELDLISGLLLSQD